MLMEARKLTKRYSAGRFCRAGGFTLHESDICLEAGETVGIFGKSGSGKTTLANLMAGILPATSGALFWKGSAIRYPFRGTLRRTVQMVYQHPEEAFDPLWTLRKSLLEPYRVHKIPFREEAFAAQLAQVGLYEEHLSRRPDALSGGELQRAALARVMIMDPELMILDEPVSMLDAVSQAQVLQILRDYQRQHQTAYLFITHNKDVMRYMCSRCYFLENGIIVKEEEVQA